MVKKMVTAIYEIDGSMGEGGGQVLRTAITLSLCMGHPILVKNIRAGRSKPGLLRQHLAAVRAAAEISDAHVSGAELGSTAIAFSPGRVKAGTYEFRIGSAGSTTLLMQTVLPALALTDAPSHVEVHGGTHNGMAPSVDFIALSFFPTLAEMGLKVNSTLHQHGFYPNGGGRWGVTIAPWQSSRKLKLLKRDELISYQAVAKLSNLQAHIAERELAHVGKKMSWNESALVFENVNAPGPGNIVSIRMQYGAQTQIFEAVGTLGISAERVAGRAIQAAKRFAKGAHVVDEYLADQLLVPMVLGNGGEYSTGALSEHCRTNIELINNMISEIGSGKKLIETNEQKCNGTPYSIIRIPQGLALNRRP